jgi:hypothetical protein
MRAFLQCRCRRVPGAGKVPDARQRGLWNTPGSGSPGSFTCRLTHCRVFYLNPVMAGKDPAGPGFGTKAPRPIVNRPRGAVTGNCATVASPEPSLAVHPQTARELQFSTWSPVSSGTLGRSVALQQVCVLAMCQHGCSTWSGIDRSELFIVCTHLQIMRVIRADAFDLECTRNWQNDLVYF